MIPVFLCGQGSSGTTLLSSLLDGHGSLVVYPNETYLLGELTNEHKKSNEIISKKFLSVNKSKFNAKSYSNYLDDHKF